MSSRDRKEEGIMIGAERRKRTEIGETRETPGYPIFQALMSY